MIIHKLRDFLKSRNIDYLWINTTDEFLVEYNELTNSSRYFVTGFTGSTGDALLSMDNLWQFADGRYGIGYYFQLQRFGLRHRLIMLVQETGTYGSL